LGAEDFDGLIGFHSWGKLSEEDGEGLSEDLHIRDERVAQGGHVWGDRDSGHDVDEVADGDFWDWGIDFHDERVGEAGDSVWIDASSIDGDDREGSGHGGDIGDGEKVIDGVLLISDGLFGIGEEAAWDDSVSEYGDVVVDGVGGSGEEFFSDEVEDEMAVDVGEAALSDEDVRDGDGELAGGI